MLMKQLLALKPAQVVEQTLEERYEESSEFDADMDTMEKHLKDVLAIVKSSNFQKHIKDTKDNFDVDASADVQDLVKCLGDSLGALSDLYDTMQEAA